MHPTRAAQLLAFAGLILLLALFALRGLSMAQTYQTAQASPPPVPSAGDAALGSYRFTNNGEQVEFEQGAPGGQRRWYWMNAAGGPLYEGRLPDPDTDPFLLRSERLFLLVGGGYSLVNASPEDQRVLSIAPAPNRRSVAFVATRGTAWGLYVLYTSGRLDWLGEQGSIHDLSWSPDGEHLAFTAPSAGYDQVFRIHRSGEQLVQLTSDPTRKSSPLWAPDGQSIVYIAMRPAFEGQGAAGQATATPQALRNPTSRTPTAALSPTPTVENAPTPTLRQPGAPVTSTPPPESPPIQFDIYTISAGGGEPRPLTSSPGESKYHLAWTSGGRELAYAVRQESEGQVSFLYALDPVEGETRRIYPHLSLDGIECPDLQYGQEGTVRLSVSNSGLLPAGIPVVLRSSGQPLAPARPGDAEARRQDAARVETIELLPGETRMVEWPVSPAPGPVTYFSAEVDSDSAVFFREAGCAARNTYFGLPNLPFLPFALPLLLAGLLLPIPWLLNRKRRWLWLAWALVPVLLLVLVLVELRWIG